MKYNKLIIAAFLIASMGEAFSKSAPYAGFGKISSSTGRVKTYSSNGYFKPSTGQYVNSYSRS